MQKIYSKDLPKTIYFPRPLLLSGIGPYQRAEKLSQLTQLTPVPVSTTHILNKSGVLFLGLILTLYKRHGDKEIRIGRSVLATYLFGSTGKQIRTEWVRRAVRPVKSCVIRAGNYQGGILSARYNAKHKVGVFTLSDEFIAWAKRQKWVSIPIEVFRLPATQARTLLVLLAMRADSRTGAVTKSLRNLSKFVFPCQKKQSRAIARTSQAVSALSSCITGLSQNGESISFCPTEFSLIKHEGGIVRHHEGGIVRHRRGDSSAPQGGWFGTFASASCCYSNCFSTPVSTKDIYKRKGASAPNGRPFHFGELKLT